MPMRVLIADDDMNLREVLRDELTYAGASVETAENGAVALRLLDSSDIDVLLLDLNMPVKGGMEVLKEIRNREIPVETIVFTAFSSVETAVEAMKIGAMDYLVKPFKIKELLAIMEKAVEKSRLLRENMRLKAQLKRQSEVEKLVTASPVMKSVIETAGTYAGSDLPVLIQGESGSGKELIARIIHQASGNPDSPFVAINCGAIPETMLESELFGYEKGSFTGASSRKIGLIETADNGVLFLDEIGELPLPLQGKLLRAVETQSFFRIGGTKEVHVRFRLLSATNRDLKHMISSKTFREDLYYRISALILDLPPLRERKEDIPLLIDYCLGKDPGYRDRKFSEEAIADLSAYPWPGNVRELRNVVQRVLLLSKNRVITSSDLPPDIIGDTPLFSGSRLEDAEREHIMRILQKSGGLRKTAAKALGIDAKTLYRKLRKYGVKETS